MVDTIDLKKKKQQEYYQKNKESFLARAAKSKAKAKERWWEFKKSLACVRCGESHPATLDFHHVIKENKKSVRGLIVNGAYRAAMREISEKCIVLCSNCHRREHYNERVKKD